MPKLSPQTFLLTSLLFTFSTQAAVLDVGPGKPFPKLESALAKAQSGDEIVVHPLAKNAPYAKTALLIKTPRLTLRAADPTQPIPLSGTGFDYSGSGSVPRAIIQFDLGSDGCTLDGFELSGARNDSNNGAGVRINQANNITIRHCKITGNDMGIMSNGNASAEPPTAADQLIEACIITDNGSEKDPGYNHNLYLGGTSVTVRGCEIARSVTGHNLKSRAHINIIAYNWIHDSANRELDLVDEKNNTDILDSNSFLLGNFIVKAPKMSGNKSVIHFGKDGKAEHTGTLYLLHNTIVTPYISPIVDLDSGIVAFLNNRIEDAKAHQAGVLFNAPNDLREHVIGNGNVLPESFLPKLPAAVKTGAPVEWKTIAIPHFTPTDETKRPPLMEFVNVGKIEERKTIEAGAGRGTIVFDPKKPVP